MPVLKLKRCDEVAYRVKDKYGRVSPLLGGVVKHIDKDALLLLNPSTKFEWTIRSKDTIFIRITKRPKFVPIV